MTYEEIISNTDYTENELIDLALKMAEQQMKNFRNQSTDNESWDHYDNLQAAFATIWAKRQNN